MPFPCKFCSALPETIASSLRHQHLHSISKTFLYTCPSSSCNFSSKSYNSINNHVSVFHREERHVNLSATETYLCDHISDGTECTFVSSSLWSFVQHLYRHLECNACVTCPIRSCDRTFTKKSTFQSHLSQYHRGWADEGIPKQHGSQRVEDQSRASTSNAAQAGLFPNMDVDDPPSCVSNDENHDLLDDNMVLDSIAKFYLQLYGMHLVPYDTIQEISDALILISELVHARIKLVMTEELKKLEVPEEKINIFCHKLKLADTLFTSHHKDCDGPSLSSDHFRLKYFAENFDYIAPKEINLNEDDPDDNTAKQEIIPVTETLVRLFQDPTVCDDIEESFLRQEQQSCSDILSDYTDGSLFQEEQHPQKEIQLFVYQDTVNGVMNPLGSAKNKYKLLTMYFTIGNLKPYHRSKVNSKHLMMIMRESVFKSVGPEKSMAAIKDELKRLEETGLLYKGEQVNIGVQYILGDNLGQHLIGGFVESFSVQFFCRFCDVTREVFKADPTVLNQPRTTAEYARCVLKAITTGKPCKGIKFASEFNSLKYTHAVSHLVPDPAHDLFEGAISWDLSGVIDSFVHSKKWFTYKLLNNRIKKLKCVGVDIPNKPAYVSSKGETLGGHAVQNWMLLRLLPIVIGDKIQDLDDPAWQFYLVMKELCEYFCAPKILKTDLCYIKDFLLPKFFELRFDVLDQEEYPLRPKHHFIMHYPELMLRYGPLIHMWTMAYEQRHKFFKQLLRLSRNFINPEWSCAVRNQMNFSFLASGSLFQEECSEKGAKHLTPDLYSGTLAAFIVTSFPSAGWRDCSSISHKNIEFKKEDVILLSSENRAVINVGYIKVIATNGSCLCFVLESHTALYDSSLGLYSISDGCGPLQLLQFDQLQYPIPQPIYFFKEHATFSLKHILCT